MDDFCGVVQMQMQYLQFTSPTIYTWGWAAVSTKYGTYFPVDAGTAPVK